MDSSSGISYLQNQIQPKELGYESEHCFSVHHLNSTQNVCPKLQTTIANVQRQTISILYRELK